ncbi:MAG TPA: IMP dehydrogenase [Bacteroidota bacterium]|nr:IMP dehydrogenase [Candidatus Kapabacteria bacterium]HRS01356.1 IMP dehydrogenase [Bacteroidota bacterium]HRT67574.1 IMP dehydrogenase [Bacteroidota bacterium]
MFIDKIISEALTYDDVLILPRHSEVLPREVNIETYLTKDIKLNIPIISAAMDTVTESSMAQAIAKEGGLGVIHKNMTIERQAEEVSIVKRSESGMISKPITLSPDNTVGDAINQMNKYKISGIPIIDEKGKLVGIITNRDLRFNPDYNIPLADVMTKDNLITAPVGTTLEEAEVILQRHRIEKLPIVDRRHILRGLITFKDIQKKKQFPNAAKDSEGHLRVGAAVGIAANTMDRVDALIEANVDIIFIDTAHGDSLGVIQMLKQIKKSHPHLPVIAGNIATAEAAENLIAAGADGLKVGIGPGSICTTRVVTGIGVPQLSAVMNVAEVASKKGIPIIADGGIKQTGDIAKAIVGGADTVMIGNMLAGHEESPGEKIILERRAYKIYRGMGSTDAMRQGSADRYFQDVEAEISKFVPEGIEGRVPYKGNVSETIFQLTGGLRAAMGYTGSHNIQELKQNGRFIKVSHASVIESHPHNVVITKESPNYFV